LVLRGSYSGGFNNDNLGGFLRHSSSGIPGAWSSDLSSPTGDGGATCFSEPLECQSRRSRDTRGPIPSAQVNVEPRNVAPRLLPSPLLLDACIPFLVSLRGILFMDEPGGGEHPSPPSPVGRPHCGPAGPRASLSHSLRHCARCGAGSLPVVARGWSYLQNCHQAVLVGAVSAVCCSRTWSSCICWSFVPSWFLIAPSSASRTAISLSDVVSCPLAGSCGSATSHIPFIFCASILPCLMRRRMVWSLTPRWAAAELMVAMSSSPLACIPAAMLSIVLSGLLSTCSAAFGRFGGSVLGVPVW